MALGIYNWFERVMHGIRPADARPEVEPSGWLPGTR
jgi:hypothetical protein